MRKAKWEICPACQGEGKSSAYLGAYSREDFAHEFSDEEQEQYFMGGYDRACERCEGSGKVSAESEAAHSSRRSDLYQQWLESGRPEGSFSSWSGM